MKKTIIFVAIFLFILAGGSALAFYAIEDNPKVAFFKAEMKNAKDTAASFEELFASDSAFMKTLNDKPFRVTGDLDVSVDMDGLGGADQAEIKKAIESVTKVKYHGSLDMDWKSKKAFGSADMKLDGDTLLSADAFADGNVLGILPNELYSKYITIDGNKFGDWMKRFSLTYAGPDKLELFGGASEDQKEKQTALLESFGKYGKLIFDEIRTDQITALDTEVGGKSAKSYTLNITASEMKALLTKLFELAVTDDELHKKLSDAVFDATFDADPDAKMSPKTMFEEALKDIRESDGVSLSIAIVVDGKGNMLKHDWEIAPADKKGKLTYFHDRSGTEKTVTLKLLDEGQEGFQVKDTYTATSGKTEHKLDFKPMGLSDFNGSFTIDYVHEAQKKQVNDAIIFKIKEIDRNISEMKFGIYFERSYAEKNRMDGKVDLSIDAEAGNNMPGSLHIKYGTKVSVSPIDAVKLPDQTNAVELTNLDDKGMAELGEQIEANLEKHVEKMMMKFQQFFGTFL